mmetsp:Transcript_49408/g.152402  ORF Transcript_49408/g.152402 Transcript_49408/m.152402 type:complete len:349 (+) Transcript_49408:3-1049(+)
MSQSSQTSLKITGLRREAVLRQLSRTNPVCEPGKSWWCHLIPTHRLLGRQQRNRFLPDRRLPLSAARATLYKKKQLVSASAPGGLPARGSNAGIAAQPFHGGELAPFASSASWLAPPWEHGGRRSRGVGKEVCRGPRGMGATARRALHREGRGSPWGGGAPLAAALRQVSATRVPTHTPLRSWTRPGLAWSDRRSAAAPRARTRRRPGGPPRPWVVPLAPGSSSPRQGSTFAVARLLTSSGRGGGPRAAQRAPSACPQASRAPQASPPRRTRQLSRRKRHLPTARGLRRRACPHRASPTAPPCPAAGCPEPWASGRRPPAPAARQPPWQARSRRGAPPRRARRGRWWA